MLENLIVPVLNRYDLLERMVASIDFPVAHLLVIDNGASTVMHDVEIDIPDVVEHTTYLPMPANLGVAGSWNLGVKSFPYAERWFFASNDVVFRPGALEKLCGAGRGDVTLAGMFPHWQAFALGREAVGRVGLFDEGFFPAYFEDTDYERRCVQAGVPIVKLDVPVDHENSSTIKSDATFAQENSRTFVSNRELFDDKVARGDYSAGFWDVTRRRENGWEVNR